MKHTVRRMFFVWDYDKQIAWLNEMAEKGLNLTKVSFNKYVFEQGTPKEYSYRMEWLKQWPTHPQSVSYIRFLQEAGVEYVASFKKWAYFRKKTSEGAFDLFSDLDSRISHLGRIITLVICLLPPLLFGLILNLWQWAKHGQMGNAVAAGMLAVMLFVFAAGLLKISREQRRLKNERIVRE